MKSFEGGEHDVAKKRKASSESSRGSGNYKKLKKEGTS